ncbi:hypothetical protein AKJ40_01160 [candidate division MSBL1 archaeon SCGC-AAA259M10]|uniref:Uncharacterized protein n=2 Tax=candidate division MSBL1 TaxID=215777 RepID=A0A656YVR3_9EURY|nr:hypothetical protein AKJ39_03130 [candidate division MSBL1 archaeon SCGC-AAA259J03]KXB00590.1 hypothetical protein AKJ40_01160 [candidate division MSBL1 archaeon SCGC-AAA259M10]
MPSREEHVRHCKNLYGYGFKEIHKWMDGTVRSRGQSHRVDRHNIKKTPDKAYDIFKDKVPRRYRKYIKDAVKDHIELDKRERSSSKTSYKKGQKYENPEEIGISEVAIFIIAFILFALPIMYGIGFEYALCISFSFGLSGLVTTKAGLWSVLIPAFAIGVSFWLFNPGFDIYSIYLLSIGIFLGAVAGIGLRKTIKGLPVT